jgi:NitT/TauT family transport system ATP-binding protein
VRPGERIGILGASGAGKSSILKLAAGLLNAQQGRLRNDFRHPVLVFQEPRLLPWCSVLENIEIPLRAARHSAADARRLALDWLQRVGLRDRDQAWPGQLSGGMAQRVALARAFALQPDLLMLDEPFSALDPGLRRSLAQSCEAGLKQTGAALLYVSHHPHELVELVDRCILLDGCRGHHYNIDDVQQRWQVAEALQRALTTLPETRLT